MAKINPSPNICVQFPDITLIISATIITPSTVNTVGAHIRKGNK